MTSPFDLSGRVAIVTGTSRGLGQTFARALARAGADIIITSRSIDSLRPFEEEIRGVGPARRPAGARRARRSQHPPRWRRRRRTPSARIDILVNNAGCNVRKRAADVTWDDWNLVLDTNLRGTFFRRRPSCAHMIPQRYGRIINIGSVTSVFGYAGLGTLRREPRRHPSDDHEPGGRLGPARHHRQLSRARLVPHRSEQGDVRRRGVGRLSGRSDSRCERPGQARTTSKARSSFWHRTRASTSPVRRCWSTAAYPPAPSGRCHGTRNNRRCRRRLPRRRAATIHHQPTTADDHR